MLLYILDLHLFSWHSSRGKHCYNFVVLLQLSRGNKIRFRALSFGLQELWRTDGGVVIITSSWSTRGRWRNRARKTRSCLVRVVANPSESKEKRGRYHRLLNFVALRLIFHKQWSSLSFPDALRWSRDRSSSSNSASLYFRDIIFFYLTQQDNFIKINEIIEVQGISMWHYFLQC